MSRKTVYYTGLGGFQKYTTDNTTFYVGRRFVPVGEGPTIKEAFEKIFSSDFVDWTAYEEQPTIDSKEIHPSVGKEDYEE